MNIADRFMASCLPILVVDANGATARQLTTQLQHSRVQVDVATSDPMAYVAVRARNYGSLVVVVDPNVEADLKFLTAFRNKVPRAWLIAISSAPHPHTREILLRCGVDSFLIAPLSLDDLILRLSAFSYRSRPHDSSG